MSDHLNRLERFLSSQGQAGEITQLTADASTREYFRIDWKGQTAVACLYTGSFVAAEHSYLDVTKLFLEADLPVARIYAFDESLGVIIQEDLGDRVLRDVLATVESERENRLRREGISLIARIQLATERAFESGSIASKLKFDKEKLLWELMYFKEHYFSTFLKAPLNAKTEHALEGNS
jgi:aminoglycoside/choline kinase family phosphotransferase